MTAWETVGVVTATPGTLGTFAAGVGMTGQSTTVRNTALGSKVNLEGIWAEAAAASIVRVRSPRLHDNVQGIRYNVPAATPLNLMGYRPQTPLVPQDLLVVEQSTAAAATTVAFLHQSYASLPGSDGNFATWGQVNPRIVDIMTQEVTPGNPTAAGQWSAGVALNSSFDLMKANTWYALLGYVSTVSSGAIAIQGPDTGGLKVGGPGVLNSLETREWFLWNDEFAEEPAIPIINSANKAGTFVYLADFASTNAAVVDLLFAELSGSTLQ
jgi:hypothetical protein